jgi:hypothetical protein
MLEHPESGPVITSPPPFNISYANPYRMPSSNFYTKQQLITTLLQTMLCNEVEDVFTTISTEAAHSGRAV